MLTPPPSWMAHFRFRSPHQWLRGTSLSSHCTDQCVLNGPATDQKVGAKTKLCVHFTLLFWTALCATDKATALWCKGTVMAVCSQGSVSAWGQVGDIDWSLSLWIQHAWQSSLSRHRIVQCRRGSSSFKLCKAQINMSCQRVWGSALFFVVVCRGGSNKAEEAGRINILVKKTPSVVWLSADSLEGEGGRTTKWNSVLNNTSHPSVNWCSNPPFSLS